MPRWTQRAKIHSCSKLLVEDLLLAYPPLALHLDTHHTKKKTMRSDPPIHFSRQAALRQTQPSQQYHVIDQYTDTHMPRPWNQGKVKILFERFETTGQSRS